MHAESETVESTTNQKSRTNGAVEHKIGELLVGMGRLKVKQVETILERQKKSGHSFGHTALEMGLIDRIGLDAALSRQFGYTTLSEKETAKLSSELVIVREPFSPTAEAIRALRTQLMIRCLENGVRTLAFVSAEAGAGRTFLAANMALAMAQLGARTLLVDADLRSPALHNLFGGVATGRGLVDILIGRSTTDEAIISDVLPKFSLLPSGPTPPNPLELLHSPVFSQVVAEVQREYDIVLFDTSPVESSADALAVIAVVVNGVVITRRHQSYANNLSHMVQLLQKSGAKLAGAFLNDH